MCGICGQFNFLSGAPADRRTLERMSNTIVHRGPDDSGVHLDGSLGLGFRRLAILDLSPAGHQPMSDPTQTVWVVFNGEIYNFQELRQELQAKGYAFRSNCDTEVIVHGYKEWGDAVLSRFNGMFGLAIWDTHRRRLVLARDPMGIKPVYYALTSDGLLFGSEIRPIRSALPQSTDVDLEAVALFLRYRYTPAPKTIHAGIRKLAAGEKLVVEDGQARVSRFYNFTPRPVSPQPGLEEATERLLELYKAAMKRHLISDVPLGLLLSGGIDSGLLLGLMHLHGKDWPTFTIGYGSSFADDELADAARTAEYYGARHHSIHIDQSTFESALPKIVTALEEPVASSSIVPMYFVCQRAREVVKVALIGQGPDELFGGYKRHLGVHHGATWRNLPGWARRTGALAARLFPRNETVQRGLKSLDEPDRLRRFQQVFSLAPESAIAGLFQPGVLPRGAADCPWLDHREAMSELDELNAFQLLELRSSLPDELLMYGDKLSMAHALEARVPYLDREVVEYVQGLGAWAKVHRRVQKRLHREVCRKFLPPEVLRRKKRGFAVNVVDEWFRESLSRNLKNYLSDPRSLLFAYLKHSTIQELISEHASARHDRHKLLFSLVVLEQWLRTRPA